MGESMHTLLGKASSRIWMALFTIPELLSSAWGRNAFSTFMPAATSTKTSVASHGDHDKEVPSAPELPPDAKPAVSLVLEPGSLLVFSDDAFIHHRHGINAVDSDEITPQVKNAKD